MRLVRRVSLRLGQRMFGVLDPLPHAPERGVVNPLVSGGIAVWAARAD
jgi:hypothetical protein